MNTSRILGVALLISTFVGCESAQKGAPLPEPPPAASAPQNSALSSQAKGDSSGPAPEPVRTTYPTPSEAASSVPSPRWGFWCDAPKPDAARPKFILMGEIHAEQNDDKKSAAIYAKRTREYYAKAARGEVYLGLEGEMASDNHAAQGPFEKVFQRDPTHDEEVNFFGLEQESSFVLANIATIVLFWSDDVLVSQVQASQRLRVNKLWSLLNVIAGLDTAKRAWTQTRESKFTDEGVEAVASTVDSLTTDAWSPGLAKQKIAQDKKMSSSFVQIANSPEIAEALRAWALTYVRQISANRKQALDDERLDMDGLATALRTGAGMDVEHVTQQFVFRLRNRDWVEQIENRYCSMARPRPLAVIVGASHVDDLKARLEAKTRNLAEIIVIK